MPGGDPAPRGFPVHGVASQSLPLTHSPEPDAPSSQFYSVTSVPLWLERLLKLLFPARPMPSVVIEAPSTYKNKFALHISR